MDSLTISFTSAYAIPVAVNPATGRDNPRLNRRASAQQQALFSCLPFLYGGLRGAPSRVAGVLFGRFVTPALSATRVVTSVVAVSKLKQESSIMTGQTSLTLFSFESHPIRTFLLEGEPWFVGKDVCEALGYKDTVNAIKQHCKGVAKYHPLQTAGGLQEVRIISESDTYRLIVGSTLPEAERFEQWLFEEVLPTIRKTGRYALGAQNQEYRLHTLRLRVLKDLASTRDAFQRHALLDSLTHVNASLNLPMPPLHLLGKPAEQIELEV